MSGRTPVKIGAIPDLFDFRQKVSGIAPEVSGTAPKVSGIAPKVSGIAPVSVRNSARGVRNSANFHWRCSWHCRYSWHIEVSGIAPGRVWAVDPFDVTKYSCKQWENLMASLAHWRQRLMIRKTACINYSELPVFDLFNSRLTNNRHTARTITD